MLDRTQIGKLGGETAYTSAGDKIGQIGEVYLDDRNGQPAWATVNTALFGKNVSFVPLQHATLRGDGGLELPYDKDRVKEAPNVGADGHLTADDAQMLYDYYGVSGGADRSADTGAAERPEVQSTAEASQPASDDAMTLSEEQLSVEKREAEVGRARIRKYVVTENVTQTIPVRKEKAVIERVPITDADIDSASFDGELSEDVHEVILHEEQIVVQKRVVPVERVRLTTQETTEDATVSEVLRKERVDTDGDIEADEQ